MKSNTRQGWFWFAAGWVMVVTGILTGELVQVVTGLAVFPLSIALLWEGSK